MSQAVVHELRVAQCSVGLISFSLSFLINDSGDSLETHVSFSSWNYHCGSACPLKLLDSPIMKLASPLILPPLYVVCRDGLSGFPTRPQLKVSISTLWLSVLYLVKILLFAWFPRETACQASLFLSICLAHLGFDCTLWLFPNLTGKSQSPKWGKPLEISLK